MSPAIQATETPTADGHHSWIGRIAYGIAVALLAAIASLLIVVSRGPSFSSGEAWEAFALAWLFFGIPIAILAGAISAATVSRQYMRQPTWVRSSLILIANVVVITVIIFVVIG